MEGNRCRLIVIDGLDGSGKQTQTAMVRESLSSMGYKARTLSFPDYDSDSSALVRMYLGGQIGSRPDDVNAYAASSFYAVDRITSYLTKWRGDYLSYDFIIADRYTTSNILHQMSKLPDSERLGFIEWLLDFEYVRLGLPEPDKVIFLDVTPAVSQRLLAERYGGDESRKDIHEKAVDYLLKCRRCAEFAVAELGWDVVHCDDGENMRTREDIRDEILVLIIDQGRL